MLAYFAILEHYSFGSTPDAEAADSASLTALDLDPITAVDFVSLNFFENFSPSLSQQFVGIGLYGGSLGIIHM